MPHILYPLKTARRLPLWAASLATASAIFLAALNGQPPLSATASAQDSSASPLVVTTTRDGGAGSLRVAILAANEAPGSTIRFAIPRSDAGLRSGVWTIVLRRSLPIINAARTTIDGTSQTRFAGNSNRTGPEIELYGGNIITAVPVPTPQPTPSATRAATSSPTPTSTAGPAPTGTPAPSFEVARPNGLTITAPFATVRGLAIGGFTGDGISLRPRILGDSSPPSVAGGNFGRVEACTIGLEAHGMRVEPNHGYGVRAEGVSGLSLGSASAERNLIAGNLISLLASVNSGTTAPAATSVQNTWFGVDVTGEVFVPAFSDPRFGSSLTDVYVFTPLRFGDTSAKARNVVAGPAQLYGAGTIQNSSFGWSASGRVASRAGLLVSGSATGTLLIGGPTPAARNYTFSCNTYSFASNTVGRVVLQNNWIGWSPANISSGNGLLAEAGLQIGAAPGDSNPAAVGNRLAGPLLLFNNPSGTRRASSVRGNILSGQQDYLGPIAFNDGLGRGYSVSANDSLDLDSGPNNTQNSPALSEARQGARGLQVSLGLHSRPNTPYVLDFYALNPATSTWTPFASRPARTQSNGDSFLSASFAGAPARSIGCTATDLSTGATSPMSAVVTAQAGESLLGGVLVTHVTPSFGAVGESFTLSGRGLSGVSTILFRRGDDSLVPAPFILVDDGTIRATIPAGAMTSPLLLGHIDGSRASLTGVFGVIAADDNDFFARARPLNGTSGAVADEFGFSAEPGEPAHAGQAAQYSTWFRWTAPRDGVVEWLVQSPPSGGYLSNVRLAAYTGAALGSLRPIASQSGDVYGNNLSIQFQARAGTTYFVAADMYQRTSFILAWRYATEVERRRAPNSHSSRPAPTPPSIPST